MRWMADLAAVVGQSTTAAHLAVGEARSVASQKAATVTAEEASEKLGTESQRHDVSLHGAHKEDDTFEDGSADCEWTDSLSTHPQS